jgi:hypothetical protein
VTREVVGVFVHRATSVGRISVIVVDPQDGPLVAATADNQHAT